MSAERILEIALAQQERGADVVKIVVNANSLAEEAEVLHAAALLKETLTVPFLLLCGGNCHVLRRVGPYFGSCTWLTVLEYDECATKAQPLLADIIALRKIMNI
jgi:3-dehydroquinate dehydratase